LNRVLRLMRSKTLLKM